MCFKKPPLRFMTNDGKDWQEGFLDTSTMRIETDEPKLEKCGKQQYYYLPKGDTLYRVDQNFTKIERVLTKVMTESLWKYKLEQPWDIPRVIYQSINDYNASEFRNPVTMSELYRQMMDHQAFLRRVFSQPRIKRVRRAKLPPLDAEAARESIWPSSWWAWLGIRWNFHSIFVMGAAVLTYIYFIGSCIRWLLAARMERAVVMEVHEDRQPRPTEEEHQLIERTGPSRRAPDPPREDNRPSPTAPPTYPKVAEWPPPLVNTMAVGNQNNKTVVNMIIQGVKRRTMIDTGADKSLIDEESAREYGVTLRDRKSVV